MVEAVMVWNEPNDLLHWDFELDPDWSIFTRMLKTAWQAIRAEHASVARVLGGISPIDPAFIENRHKTLLLLRLVEKGDFSFALDFTHQSFNLVDVAEVRIICVQFLIECFAAIHAAEGELVGNVVDAARDGFESGSGGVPSPAVVHARVASARAFADRERGKNAVIEAVLIRGAEVVVNVIRRRAVVRLKENFEADGADIGRVHRQPVGGGESGWDQREQRAGSDTGRVLNNKVGHVDFKGSSVKLGRADFRPGL
ncbi:MAG TPA: hypothetical protein VMG40_17095 [Bryobacteraceae bacterium]|nr:hypothetical protein [Bryobacteraceae bacterium]